MAENFYIIANIECYNKELEARGFGVFIVIGIYNFDALLIFC